MKKHKVIEFRIVGKDEKFDIVCKLFLVPGCTPKVITDRLKSPDYVLINPVEPKVFRPEEDLYKAIKRGGKLTAVPIRWPDAAWWKEYQGAEVKGANWNSVLRRFPKTIWKIFVREGRVLWERISLSRLKKAASSGLLTSLWNQE
jgi:hypothetical protein